MRAQNISKHITTPRRLRAGFVFLLGLLYAATLTSCHHMDNKRLPATRVNIVFWTQAEWITYGPAGAAGHKDFIRELRRPADFPYTASTYTGFGGVLLCTDYSGNPMAYDLACPVECNAQTRVYINDDLLAECPKCHSLYDVFALGGGAVGGPAANNGYGLQVYRVGAGMQGEYLIVTY